MWLPQVPRSIMALLITIMRSCPYCSAKLSSHCDTAVKDLFNKEEDLLLSGPLHGSKNADVTASAMYFWRFTHVSNSPERTMVMPREFSVKRSIR
uniref:Putative secreted protein n=1 Tax=Rhipicephalus microplus TaxID=6941 RepID=A0A6G5A3N0_RHIMP